MEIANSLITLFTSKYSVAHSTETLDLFEMRYRCDNITAPENDALLALSQQCVAPNDTLEVSVFIGDDEPVIFSSRNPSATFKDTIDQRLRLLENEEIGLLLEVHKRVQNNSIYVYSAQIFERYLNTLSLEQILKTLSNAANPNGLSLIFRTSSINCYTTLFNLSNLEQPFTVDIGFRSDRIESIKNCVFSSHLASNILIPEDFIFVRNDNLFPSTKDLFERVALILCIIAIFDTTSVSGNTLTYKLNGYRTLNGVLDFGTYSSFSLEAYKSIYLWIYGGSNINDKIGLARNIISLNLIDPASIELLPNTLPSLLSSYKVYEKQNIQQYIEIRNKISDQIINFNNRANQIADNFAGGFQRSAISLLTLFSSIVAIRLLTSATISFLFIYYATFLSLLFVIGTIIYLIIARIEVKHQLIRFTRSYFDLKKRYTDLLTPEDIQKIVNEDADYTADIDFISKKRNWYTILWVIIITFIFISTVVFYITGDYTLSMQMVPKLLQPILSYFKI